MRKITPGTILALPDAIKIIQEQQAMIAELQRLLETYRGR